MAADSCRLGEMHQTVLLHAPSFNKHGQAWQWFASIFARDIARTLANIAVSSLGHEVKEVHMRYMRGGKGGAQGRAVIGVAWIDTLTLCSTTAQSKRRVYPVNEY